MGITSNEVWRGRGSVPVQSAMTTTPGSTLCASTADRVDGKNLLSSSTVITAATESSTSWLCVYVRDARTSPTNCSMPLPVKSIVPVYARG